MKNFWSRFFGWISRDALLLHTGLLFSAMMVSSVCNIGYQMVVSRVLPKSEYALLATFLALIAIASRPLGTVSTAMTHHSSLLAKEDRMDSIRRLLAKWVLLAGIPAIALAVITVLISSQIAQFFHLTRRAPVIVVALALPGIFVAPVFGGVINGLQKFGWVSFSSIVGAMGRVLMGFLFVLFVAPACGWALAGHVGGLYVSVVISAFVLRRYLAPGKTDQQALPSIRGYLLQCFLVQVGAAVLMTGDIVMVQRYMPNENEFAFAATLGRMVTFMAVSVASSMFPKVSSTGAFLREHRRVYLRAQLYTGGFVLLAMAICCLVPELLHRILFKITNPDAALIGQTRGMAVVMGISTLLNINVSLLLAQRRFRSTWVVVAASAGYIMAVWFFHESVFDVIVAGAITNMCALVFTTYSILKIKCSGAETGDN